MCSGGGGGYRGAAGLPLNCELSDIPGLVGGRGGEGVGGNCDGLGGRVGATVLENSCAPGGGYTITIILCKVIEN